MLDWLSSRVGMMFAAVVVTGSLIGFFMWQQNSFDEIQRQKSVDFIADHIDHISSLSSNHRELMTFDKEKKEEGVYIGSRIGGETFTLTITSNLVVMKQDGEEQVVSSLSRKIHLLNPWNLEVIKTSDIITERYLEEGYLFQLSLNYLDYFQDGPIDKNLCKAFEINRINPIHILSSNAEMVSNNPDLWIITDGPREYRIELTNRYLFSLELEYNKYLENGIINDQLKTAFNNNSPVLSNNSILTKVDKERWEIIDGMNKYGIQITDSELKIYKILLEIFEESKERKNTLSINPGEDFYVESLLLNMTTPYSSLEREYHTFVYLA